MLPSTTESLFKREGLPGHCQQEKKNKSWGMKSNLAATRLGNKASMSAIPELAAFLTIK